MLGLRIAGQSQTVLASQGILSITKSAPQTVGASDPRRTHGEFHAARVSLA